MVEDALGKQPLAVEEAWKIVVIVTVLYATQHVQCSRERL